MLINSWQFQLQNNENLYKYLYVFDFDLFLIKVRRNTTKGGLISESFFSSSSILQKKVPNHYSDHLIRWMISSVQDSDLASFLGDLSQSDKLSEIKLPLRKNRTLKTVI